MLDSPRTSRLEIAYFAQNLNLQSKEQIIMRELKSRIISPKQEHKPFHNGIDYNAHKLDAHAGFPWGSNLKRLNGQGFAAQKWNCRCNYVKALVVHAHKYILAYSRFYNRYYTDADRWE
jgi:hypothetical protein